MITNANAHGGAAATPGTQLLTPRQTAALLGVHLSTIYRYISEEGFPAPIRLGRRASRFVAAEVTGWIATRAALRAD